MENDGFFIRELGETIREVRINKQLTQQQVCSDMISRTTLSKIENGHVEPSLETLMILLNRLDIELQDFLKLLPNNSYITKKGIEDEYLFVNFLTCTSDIRSLIDRCDLYLVKDPSSVRVLAIKEQLRQLLSYNRWANSPILDNDVSSYPSLCRSHDIFAQELQGFSLSFPLFDRSYTLRLFYETCDLEAEDEEIVYAQSNFCINYTLLNLNNISKSVLQSKLMSYAKLARKYKCFLHYSMLQLIISVIELNKVNFDFFQKLIIDFGFKNWIDSFVNLFL